MKRVLTLVLALMLVCGVAVTVAAVDFGVAADPDAILAGEEVTITVTLDETIPASEGATALQGQLYYDTAALTYKAGSEVVNEAYAALPTWMFKDMPNRERVQFSAIDMTGGTLELPAGTVLSVTFVANEDMTEAALEASFTLDMTVANGFGENLLDKQYTTSITICAGHTWDEGTGTPATCTEDGEVTYTCTACGATKTETQTATGHKQSEWATNIEYLTDEEGMMTAIVEEYACEYCGLVMEVDTIYCLSLDEEGNLFPDDKTVEIAAGETAHYYAMGFGGYTLLVKGENVSVNVVINDWMTGTTVNETYTAVDGVVTVPISGWEAELYITNNGTAAAAYDLELLIPVGDYANPHILTPGDNTIEIAEDAPYEYYARYVADCSGTITLTFAGEHWNYRINNYGPDIDDYSDNVYGDTYGAHDEVVVNSQTIEVKAGDIIEIIMSTAYDPDPEDWSNEWESPAATITVNVGCDYTHEGHIVHVEAVEPGCENEGNVEYWYCENCEMVWTDEALTQLSNFQSVKLPITHQNVVHVEAVKPGCETEGNVEYWYCADCNMVWADEGQTMVSNHNNMKLAPTHWNIVHVEAVEPGCETEGNIEYWYCQDCGIHWQDEAMLQITNSKNVILPAAHKNIVHVEAVEPGCHYEGNVEFWYCADCVTVWTDEAMQQISNMKNVIIPELGGDVVHVEAKDPTCTVNGNIEHWYCETCEQVWQDEALTQLTNHKNVVLAATGHNYGADGICTICGDNPKSGDNTMISVAIAAALVSVMSVVALPVIKKRF